MASQRRTAGETVGIALNPKSVLVMAPNWVGDSIFMLPAVAALKRHFGASARFTLLAKPGICALHAASPLFNEFVPLEGKSRLARLVTQAGLRGRRFDLSVVFPNSFSSGLGAFISGARVRVGRPGQGRDWLLNLTSPMPAANRQRHVSEEYLDLARLAGVEPVPEDKLLKLSLTQGGSEEQSRLFREHGLTAGPLLIALCPTSAYGPGKMWPAAKFAELARLLKSQRFQPYLLCAPTERSQVLEIARQAGEVPVLAPSLPGLAAALSASSVVVANDSGPLHIAAAVGTRCVGLYGPVDPKWSAPLSARAKVLYRAETCSPCYARVCPLGHHDCLEKIDSVQVMQALQELLKL